MNDQFIEFFSSKLGIQLNNFEETYNVLNVDQQAFQNNLRAYLSTNERRDQQFNLSSLKEFLESYFENEVNFLVALQPTKVNSEQIVHHSSVQDNFIKLLIELEQLQNFLFELLITKIISYAEISSNDIDENSRGMVLELSKIEVPIHITNQFRYQPKIFEPDALCKKLLSLLEMLSSNPIKKEIISCFSDILCDSIHDNLADELQSLLDSNTELLPSILEVLTSLKFQDETIKKFVEKLFDMYAVINEEDIHAVIKFILKSASVTSSTSMLEELLVRLKFDELENEQNKHVVFEVINEFFQISNELIELYRLLINQKLIESSDKSNETLFKPIDFLIITIIYSIPQQFKTVDKLFKQLIKNDSKKEIPSAIKASFKFGKLIMKDMFESLCLIGKSLIQNAIPALSDKGKLIYSGCYANLTDKKMKQKIISILVENIVCFSDCTRDNSLDILIKLSDSTQDETELVSHSNQIKTLLDFIEYFNLNQIRKLYQIVCSIAYATSPKENKQSSLPASLTSTHPSSSSANSLPSASMLQISSIVSNNSIQDNLYILIKKQLSSSSLKYKQIGVIGALTMIKCIANKTQKSDDDNDSFFSCSTSFLDENKAPNNSQDDRKINEIKQIWQMILDSSKSNAESLGLFEDDLTCILRKESLPEDVELLIKHSLKSMTSSLFKLNPNYQSDLEKYAPQLASFKIGYEFGIDDQAVGALNLMSQLMSEIVKKNIFLAEYSSNMQEKGNKRDSTLPTKTIASTIRLIAALERKNLNEIIDYLGLPILTISKEELYKYGNMNTNQNDSSAASMSSMNETSFIISNGNLLKKFKTSLSDEERRIICDTIFYLMNYFIELINAFSQLITYKETSNEIKIKLIMRLTSVFELNHILASLLPYMKFYRPPTAVFGLVDTSSEELPYIHTLIKIKEPNSKKSKQPAKKKRKAPSKAAASKKSKVSKKSKIQEENGLDESANSNDEKTLIDDSNDSIEPSEVENNNDDILDDSNECLQFDLSKISIYFRDFDLSVINFVNLKLDLIQIIPDTNKRDPNFNPNQAKIAPHLLHFILSDLNRKLPVILKSEITAKTNSDESSDIKNALKPAGFGLQSSKPTKIQLFVQLNTFSAKELMKFIMENCFDNICNHLNDIYKHIKSIQDRNDGIKDPAELYSNKNNLSALKCLNQLLKLIFSLLNWLYLSRDTTKKLIDYVISTIGSKVELTNSNISTQVSKAPEVFCYNYLSKLKDVIVDLETGDVLIKIMDLLSNKIFLKFTSLNTQCLKNCRLILINTCDQLLLNDYNPKLTSLLISSKQANNEAITNILNFAIANRIEENNSMDFMEKICNIITNEDFVHDRKECGDYNTIKNHFVQYFKVLIEFTVNDLKYLSKFNSKEAGSDRATLKSLSDRIRRLVGMHCGLIELKKFRSFKDINILTILKNSKLFILNILKYAMPWLDKSFESHKETVVSILERLQENIHFLKETFLAKSQSASVDKQAPAYNRAVEQFSLRVKQLLYVNQADDAFTVSLSKNPLAKNKKVLMAKKPAKVSSKLKNLPEPSNNDNDDDEDEEDDDNSRQEGRGNNDNDDREEDNDDDEDEDDGDETDLNE